MTSIKKLREKIDADIIDKISQRNILSIKIGQLKTKLDKDVFDKKREEEQMLYYKKICNQYQLSPSFIKGLFRLIIINSRKLQK